MKGAVALDGYHDERRREGTLRDPVDGTRGGSGAVLRSGHKKPVSDHAQGLLFYRGIHSAPLLSRTAFGTSGRPSHDCRGHQTSEHEDAAGGQQQPSGPSKRRPGEREHNQSAQRERAPSDFGDQPVRRNSAQLRTAPGSQPPDDQNDRESNPTRPPRIKKIAASKRK